LASDSGDPSGSVEPFGRTADVARGAWYGGWSQAVDKLLPVAVLLYLARTLSPDDFGVYTFVLAYLAFFQALSDYGIDTVLVRSMSQDPKRAVPILRAGLGLKLLLALLSVPVAVLLAGPASGGRVSVGLTLIASLSLPTALGGAYRAFFRSQLEIRSVFRIAAGRAALYAVAIVAAVASGAGVAALFGAVAVANFLTFVGVAFLLRRRVAPGLEFDRQIWGRLLSGALPLVANALAMTVSLRIGQILLMSLDGPVAVGMLGAASRVTEAFTLIPEALMVTVYPLMAGLHVSSPDRLGRTASRSARYLVVIVGIPVTLCVVVGPEIMAFLFGSAFEPAGNLLRVLAFTALLGASGTVILNVLVAIHHEKTLFATSFVFAALNVVLSWVLISGYGGMGAAVAMLVTSAASQIVLALLPGVGVYVRPVVWVAVLTTLAVLIADACVLPLAGQAVQAAVVATAVYGVVLIVFRVVDAEEGRFVREMVRSFRRKGG
jgi:O-antigen/teichoic acid export membrane protein